MYIKQRAAPGHRQSSQYISSYHSRRCGKQQVKSPTKAFSFLAALTSTVFYLAILSCVRAGRPGGGLPAAGHRGLGARAGGPRLPRAGRRAPHEVHVSRTGAGHTCIYCATCNSVPRASGGRRILRRPGHWLPGLPLVRRHRGRAAVQGST